MSSSDDDVPLVKGKQTNGVSDKSPDVIPKSLDKEMDKQGPKSNGHVEPGISVANGPVNEMDVDQQGANGANGSAPNKRKSRTSVPSKSYKEASDSEDDEKPLSKRRKTTTKEDDSDDEPLVRKAAVTKPPEVAAAQIGEEDDSDVPLDKKLTKQKANIEKAAEKEAKAIRSNDAKKRRARKAASDSEDEKPLSKKKAAPAKPTPAKPKARTNGVKKEESEDDVPLRKKVQAAASTPDKKGKGKKAVKEEEEVDFEGEEDDENNWWNDPTGGDDSIKWNTLEHNGVVFPPPYEPLPKNVKLKYDGIPISLEPEAEEVATFFGSMLNSTHNVENPTFRQNFFADFQAVLKKHGKGGRDRDGNLVQIEKFEKCDFKSIFDWFDTEREKKKALPAAEKKAIKKDKDEKEAPYAYCLWNGKKQKVGNFRVEPPGLFRGRGEHPKTGKVKKRVQAEQITINIGKEATVPAPPEGHAWKEIRHDQTGTWLAMWQENINGAYKYVMLAANSDVKGQADHKKFEKARELKKYIDVIRKDYTRDLKSEVMADRQRATAVYLIDQFALRAGNEKNEDEADTVGCCSLKYEHITLQPPNKVIFDFLGKDSIRFYDEVTVDAQVFKNLRIFKKAPKGEGDEIFDRLNTASLNKHLGNYMPGLTAKVFRTYNASWTMAKLLKEMKETGLSIPEKVKDYNDANRKVAILCNHKRTVTAGHAGQMEKMQDKINGLRFEQWRIRQMMLDLDPKEKKRRGAEFFELPEDLQGEDWVKNHHAALVEEQRQKITKKFEKDNEKLKANGEKELKQKELKERMEVATDLEKKFKRELKTGKVEAEGKGVNIEKLDARVEKLDERIRNMSTQAEDKDANKEVALGTSKINYIDPRLTVVFSKKFDVPIERFFSKTLRDKFKWAIESVDEDWDF
ncbi:putative DNA topoisomerase 1 [Viridothelium virens]|uniref:DNA topoisomerase I n=1 Tax=Viridothelium virens TaxID=1048519 RepID=A0A6A6GU55_VIRVR|nr:putative DNA topoisomerase 1 [Viridothelium virens]